MFTLDHFSIWHLGVSYKEDLRVDASLRKELPGPVTLPNLPPVRVESKILLIKVESTSPGVSVHVVKLYPFAKPMDSKSLSEYPEDGILPFPNHL